MVPRPVLPEGKELYDEIMRGIEPELTHEELSNLDAKYKSETPEQHKARMQRYQDAFKEYDEAYKETMRRLDEQVTGYRRSILVQTEEETREADSSRLGILEQQFSTAA